MMANSGSMRRCSSVTLLNVLNPLKTQEKHWRTNLTLFNLWRALVGTAICKCHSDVDTFRKSVGGTQKRPISERQLS